MGHGPGMLGNWKGEGEKGLGVKEARGGGGRKEGLGLRGVTFDTCLSISALMLQKRGSERTFLEDSFKSPTAAVALRCRERQPFRAAPC